MLVPSVKDPTGSAGRIVDGGGPYCRARVRPDIRQGSYRRSPRGGDQGKWSAGATTSVRKSLLNSQKNCLAFDSAIKRPRFGMMKRVLIVNVNRD